MHNMTTMDANSLNFHTHERGQCTDGNGSMDSIGLSSIPYSTVQDLFDDMNHSELERLCAVFVITACYTLHQDLGNKAPDIRMSLQVTLEDLYEGCCKTVTYRTYDAFGRKHSRKIRLNLVNPRDTYVFVGLGDSSPFYDMSPGDVILDLHVARHPVFRPGDDIMYLRHDLITTMYVTLFDFYYGRKKKIFLPVHRAHDRPSRSVEILYDEEMTRRKKYVIKGEGLPTTTRNDGHMKRDCLDESSSKQERGDIIVEFQIILPCFPRWKLANFVTRSFMWRNFGDPSVSAELTKTSSSSPPRSPFS